MSTTILEIDKLSVSFDGFKAIDGLDFYVDRNELHVVIGPNGAGKTTLLDMICGKTKPTDGTILFNGLNLERMLEFQITRAGVGRKFQTPLVYEDLTVYENFEISYPKKRDIFGCLFFKRDKAVREEVARIANLTFLEDQMQRKASHLSHGQKQWLEIGMLLMQDPQLLLLDEPVAGMSARERELTGDLLRTIAEGRSMVIIEHDMEFVRSVAQKVTVLHQGKILAEGSMDHVQRDPRVIEVYLGH